MPGGRARPLTRILLIAAALAVLATPAAMAAHLLRTGGASAPATAEAAPPKATDLEPVADLPGSAAPDAAAAPPAKAADVLPRSAPVRLHIPKIKLSAPLMALGVDGDGVVQVPPLNRPQLAGWYRHGPTPGEIGPAVILGHVDTTTGPAVFARLHELAAGDLITVTRKDGRRATFTVQWLTTVAKTRFPTRRVYGPLEYAGLRLITCGGSFDHGTRSYTDNMIVYARLK
ncbi:class F sortase [Planobispora rosea]|uniref:class F sortase n=1 Tax=Planobispora rosea TaxID=35762 RepID=UPI001FD33764|nr:class F sortase [Planobispora rosea]